MIEELLTLAKSHVIDYIRTMDFTYYDEYKWRSDDGIEIKLERSYRALEVCIKSKEAVCTVALNILDSPFRYEVTTHCAPPSKYGIVAEKVYRLAFRTYLEMAKFLTAIELKKVSSEKELLKLRGLRTAYAVLDALGFKRIGDGDSWGRGDATARSVIKDDEFTIVVFNDSASCNTTFNAKNRTVIPVCEMWRLDSVGAAPVYSVTEALYVELLKLLAPRE